LEQGVVKRIGIGNLIITPNSMYGVLEEFRKGTGDYFLDTVVMSSVASFHNFFGAAFTHDFLPFATSNGLHGGQVLAKSSCNGRCR
jgi:hypothetical protein